MRPVLLVPGIHNSGPRHWQSLWQAQHAGVSRVAQSDWDHPVCSDWVAALDAAVAAATEPPIVVAHSLGCLAAMHCAARQPRPVHALLLVAVPDPQGPQFPVQARGFDPLPAAAAPARRVVLVSSRNDPYATPAFAAHCAVAWQAGHVALGALGHLNADSGLGDWREGWSLVERWRAEPA